MKTKNESHIEFLVYFLSLVFLVTFTCGLVYVTVQQNYRQSANDPQIQMSEDIAQELARGSETSSSVVVGKSVDIAKSLAPFIIIYNDLGNPVASTARLDNQIPIIPSGVLEYTRMHRQDRLTWEPKINVREAAIITHFSGKTSGFVLAGRNLREIEKREDKLVLYLIFGWVVGVIASPIMIAILIVFVNRDKNHLERS